MAGPPQHTAPVLLPTILVRPYTSYSLSGSSSQHVATSAASLWQHSKQLCMYQLCLELTMPDSRVLGQDVGGEKEGLSWINYPDFYKEGKPGNKIATCAAAVPGRFVPHPTRCHISTNAAMLEQLSRPEWQQQA